MPLDRTNPAVLYNLGTPNSFLNLGTPGNSSEQKGIFFLRPIRVIDEEEGELPLTLERTVWAIQRLKAAGPTLPYVTIPKTPSVDRNPQWFVVKKGEKVPLPPLRAIRIYR